MTAGAPQPARRQLPNRRLSEIHEIEVAGQAYSVSFGFYENGSVGEIFLFGPKSGSTMAAVLSDAAILASLALQFGAPPGALARSMSRIPIDPWGTAREPASPVGAAMDLLAAVPGAGLREP